MARHVPLYQAVLNVLRAIALCPVLLPLLLPRSNGYSPSHQDRASLEAPCIATLLDKMRQCVDTYSRTLRFVSQHSRWQFHNIKRDAVKTYTWTLTCNVVLIFWAWAACDLLSQERVWCTMSPPSSVADCARAFDSSCVQWLDQIQTWVFHCTPSFKIRISELVLKLHALTSILSVFQTGCTVD